MSRRRAAALTCAFVLASCTGSPELQIAPSTLGPPTTPAPTADSTVSDQPEEVTSSVPRSTNLNTTATSQVDPSESSTSATATTATTNEPATTASVTTTAPLADQPLVGSYVVEILSVRPHDPTAYTQGLEVHNGTLLESTGRWGESELRRVDPETGEILAAVPLADELFGEGLTVADDAIYQLTWKSGRVFVADPSSLASTGELAIETEGWGICFDGTHLVTSDGTSTLAFRQPATLAVVRTVTVQLNGDPVSRINELECDGGQIIANIFGLDQIIAVDPTDGTIQAVIDASSLRPADLPITDLNYALNGIAAIPGTDTYYLTGKWWPVLYEVRLVAQ